MACETIGSPPTGCRTFGIVDRMRVPSPAARMIDSNSAMPAPFSTPDLAIFYGSNVLGNHYVAGMVNLSRQPVIRAAWRDPHLAKMTEQFSARDVTTWGVFALVVWSVALLGSTLSLQVPDGWLAGLHSTRLGGANMSQLRGQIADLQTQAA